MTDQEAIKIWEEIKEHFGEKLANPEHHPKIFEYQVRLFKYYKERK